MAQPAPQSVVVNSATGPFPLAAAAKPQAVLTMAQALDAAWSRSVESAEATGREDQAQAYMRVAGAWLAAAPTLELSQREGRGSAGAGSRETELGVALPLWRLGQRQQNVQAAQAESAWADATKQAARLRLAGQLRNLASKLRLAEADLAQAIDQRQLLDKLSADVNRRVAAGDLATTDAMAAKAEMLEARRLQQQAEQTLAALRSSWALLTGSTWPVQPETSAPAVAAGSEHPLEQHAEAQLAEAAVQRARHRYAQVLAQRGAPPELGLGVRQERPAEGQPRQNSVALSLRVPLGTQIYSQPQLAAALAEQDVALAAQRRVRLQLEAEVSLARSDLASSLLQTEAETERAALLRERAQHLNRSFQAGESPLSELLRAVSVAAQAVAASARQQAALAQAQARLQQALGQLP